MARVTVRAEWRQGLRTTLVASSVSLRNEPSKLSEKNPSAKAASFQMTGYYGQ